MEILILIWKNVSYGIKEYLMALILMILTNFLASFALSFWDPLLMSELHTMTLSCNMTKQVLERARKLLDFLPMKLPIVYLFLWSPLVTTKNGIWHVV